jgi:hypothetical protein
MRIFILVILILTIVGCANTQTSDASFSVLSFSQGKMTETDNDWFIYEAGEEMEFQENGCCIFNKNKYPCMWHGFVLKYNSAGQNVSLNCLNKQSEPTNYGNPNELISEQSNEVEYSVPSKRSEDTFINPQYISKHSMVGTILSATECKFNGKVVIQFKQVFHFGPNQTQT